MIACGAHRAAELYMECEPDKFEAYGYPRARAELRHPGAAVNIKKFRRLMRAHEPAKLGCRMLRSQIHSVKRTSPTSIVARFRREETSGHLLPAVLALSRRLRKSVEHRLH